MTVHSSVCVLLQNATRCFCLFYRHLLPVQWLVVSFLTWHSLHGKPAIQGSNLTFHRYHVTALMIIIAFPIKCKYFFHETHKISVAVEKRAGMRGHQCRTGSAWWRWCRIRPGIAIESIFCSVIGIFGNLRDPGKRLAHNSKFRFAELQPSLRQKNHKKQQN